MSQLKVRWTIDEADAFQASAKRELKREESRRPPKRLPPRSEEEERYGPVEAAPYYGTCSACRGWYERGAKTRFHFLNGQALREHAQCGALAAPSYPARTTRAQQIALELSA